MKYTMLVALGLLSACFTFLACSGDKTPLDSPEDTPKKSASSTMKSGDAKAGTPKDVGNQLETPINDTRFHAKLKEIVGEYQEYDVSGSRFKMIPRCAMFTPNALKSQSSEGEHAKKDALFFAKDSTRYNLGTMAKVTDRSRIEEPKDVGGDVALAQRVGQAIVKEALARDEDGYASTYHDREPGRLFIMTKLDPKTDGTDQGWVYGIVEADKTITGSGRIQSCMGCHRGAEHDRVFGLRNAIQADVDKWAKKSND